MAKLCLNSMIVAVLLAACYISFTQGNTYDLVAGCDRVCSRSAAEKAACCIAHGKRGVMTCSGGKALCLSKVTKGAALEHLSTCDKACGGNVAQLDSCCVAYGRMGVSYGCSTGKFLCVKAFN